MFSKIIQIILTVIIFIFSVKLFIKGYKDSKSDFEKAIALNPQKPSDLHNDVIGPSYIYAIISDSRIRWVVMWWDLEYFWEKKRKSDWYISRFFRAQKFSETAERPPDPFPNPLRGIA